MYFTANEIYHVYNRGNNKQLIFFNNANYLHFLNKIRKEWKDSCEILCWCLMPNHFHCMLKATEKSCKEILAYGDHPMQLLSRKFGLFLSSYAQYINYQNKSSGSLFQQKTKAKCISDTSNLSSTNYITTCMHYIHQNPWTAGLVKKMEDWQYSSFADYAGMRKGTLCNKELLMALIDYDKDTFYKDSYNRIDDNDLNKIW